MGRGQARAPPGALAALLADPSRDKPAVHGAAALPARWKRCTAGALDSRSEWVRGEIRLVGEGHVRRDSKNPMTPPEDKIDPIQYAWGRCNHGVSLPAVLTRGAFRDPIIARGGGEAAAAKATTHSGIIRRRFPRRVQGRS